MTNPPRVAINGRAAVRSHIGGVERLAREMAARLPGLRPERYQVVEPPPALAHRAGHLWEQAALPLLARRSALIYSPANLAPVVSTRNVVVIHDVAALRHPDSYSRAYVRYQRAMLPLLAGRARRLITVSQFSKWELVEVLGAAPDLIDVAAPGVDERFRPGIDPAPALAEYRLERPYVLAVGTASARKNLPVLESVRRRLSGEGVDLVLAGSDRGYLKAPSVAVRRLGYVAESHLPGLYAGAQALVLPSLYEGFGLPCLEAMACGTPVVCSPFGALPETCGDSAVIADPRDAGAFSDAVVSLVADQALRARLSEAGLSRARTFTWERTARLTDASLDQALESL